MKVPLSWIREYVEFDAEPDGLASRLTFAGLEVKGVERVGSDYEGIVVGEVLSVEQHPNADRLVLCRVSDGAQEHRIVCGARNFGVGDKAPFIRAGSSLPDGTRVKKAKIRGEESSGMLCSEKELGISDSHGGIMVLARDVPAGLPFAKLTGGSETIFELEITWNRPDLLGVIGVAREVAALYGLPLKLPPVEFPEDGDAIEKLASVRIADPDKCFRYVARVLQGVKQGESPDWMRNRLALCGVRPIGNVVDITNYVMLECGQPLHAFDHDLLAGREIAVRCAGPGEKMKTLDGAERSLTPDTLVIADAAKPVALAGVMGGEGSEIRGNTVNVLLESACFDAPAIRKTSERLGLFTESSHRFERGSDPACAEWASRRAAFLMVAHAGAAAARGAIDIFPRKPEERSIKCRFRRVGDLLGMDVGADRVVSILTALQLPVVGRDANECVVAVPTFRPDLRGEADLIEEVARVHGLDKLPEVGPQSRIVVDADDKPARAALECGSRLAALGLAETLNYSFASDRLLDLVMGGSEDRVVLPNPVSADHAVLRPSLIPQMLETLGRNRSRQIADAALFEIGRAFRKTGAGGIMEEDLLCIGLMGMGVESGLRARHELEPEEVFLRLKGIVESIGAAQRVRKLEFSAARDSTDLPACFEPGAVVVLSADGRPFGFAGLVKKAIAKEWRLLDPVGIAEMRIAPLLAHVREVPGAKPVPVYPSMSRDVALVVDEAVTHEEVARIMRKNAPKQLTRIELFDIFRGAVIGEGKKSMAYSLTYRSADGTLTDEEANRCHESVKEALKKNLSTEIREA